MTRRAPAKSRKAAAPDAPAIGAIAPWFGGKRTLAPRIVAELGDHRAYWEVFCGSMAVLMDKPPATMETANDLHGDLVNLARVIQDERAGSQLYRRLRARVIQDERAGSKLYRRLRRTLLARDLFEDSAAVVRKPWMGDSPDVDRAYHYFFVSWLGRNGVAGTSNYNAGFCVRYTKNGGHAAKRFASAVESIPAWRRRMRNLTILRECGVRLCERIEDAPGVVIYADPPYVVKGASYVHDFSGIDHHRLASALGRFRRTRVVVSYYDHPHVRRWYDGWTVVECPTTKAMVNQGMRDAGGAVKAPEVLLLNGPSYTEGTQ